MCVRGLRLVLVLAGMAVFVGGSAVLYARQQAAGSILPGSFLIINKTQAEAVPVTLVNTDSKFPVLSVAVLTTPSTDLSDRTLARLAPLRQTWEYNVMSLSDVDPTTRLNTAGREGWELVSVLTTAKGNSFVMKRLGR